MSKMETESDIPSDLTKPKNSDFDRPTAEEGARLVRAFLRNQNAAVRNEIVSLIEQMSKVLSGVASDGSPPLIPDPHCFDFRDGARRGRQVTPRL